LTLLFSDGSCKHPNGVLLPSSVQTVCVFFCFLPPYATLDELIFFPLNNDFFSPINLHPQLCPMLFRVAAGLSLSLFNYRSTCFFKAWCDYSRPYLCKKEVLEPLQESVLTAVCRFQFFPHSTCPIKPYTFALPRARLLALFFPSLHG